MSDIKFRAWCYLNKKMYYSVVQYLGCLRISEDLGYRDGSLSLHSLIASRELFSVMQFTGLRDKNEKEIYEGDIIFHPHYGAGKIVYAEACFCTVHCDVETELYNCFYDCKIIGNIHENPELLEGEQNES